MSKITAEQLERSAIVYVRQSTAFQVVNNIESGRRQYGLVERARQLGWTDVQVIDDDLGRSGGGIVRPGFERLLAAICERRVGAVLSIEASRLARNGRDWHTLLEFCGLVGTLIVDEDGVYDPRSINDRLLLGMKGTMSVITPNSPEEASQSLTTQLSHAPTDHQAIPKPDIHHRQTPAGACDIPHASGNPARRNPATMSSTNSGAYERAMSVRYPPIVAVGSLASNRQSSELASSMRPSKPSAATLDRSAGVERCCPCNARSAHAIASSKRRAAR
jgi:hypothetical protein